LPDEAGHPCPARSIIRANPAVVNGAPRSLTNTNGLASLSRCIRRSARNSDPLMLNVFVPEIGLQGARIMTGVREREAARVPEHVGVGFKFEASGRRRATGCEHPRS
jgi:hypothetical protein